MRHLSRVILRCKCGQRLRLNAIIAEELNAKAQIAYRICDILEERKLTQKAAAALLGIDQPKVSALLRGRLEGFSSDRLFRFLNALDRDIEICHPPDEEAQQ